MLSERFIKAFLSWKVRGLSLPDWQEIERLYSEHEPFHKWPQGLSPPVAEWLNGHSFWWEKAQREHDYLLQNGVEFSLRGEANYPSQFLKLSHPPAAICYRGERVWEEKAQMAVVGSREPSLASVRWMEHHLPQFLKDQEVAVLSGGARGIDQKAHALSLLSGAPTVCFLPSGFAQAYPRSIVAMLPRIVELEGCIVSPFSPFEPMQKGHFHVRNRLMAAMAKLVFVVEARRRSGTLLTAKWAAELGKEICVLPRCPMDHLGMGSLDLLFEGAHPIRDADDLRCLWQTS